MSTVARIRELDRELDKTMSWEEPQYRVFRQKLNRERNRLVNRTLGRDPEWFARGAGKKERTEKQEVLNILKKLEGVTCKKEN